MFRHFWTVVAAVCALLVFSVPALQPILIYDRHAIFSGEIWRLFTGHWVHFSTSHLLLDAAVLLVAGWSIETQRDSRWPIFVLICPWIISAALIVFEPNMRFYGGLSGLATGAMTYLALVTLKEQGHGRWIGGALLLVIIGKAIVECLTGETLLTLSGDQSFVPVPWSHLAGVAVALTFHLARK